MDVPDTPFNYKAQSTFDRQEGVAEDIPFLPLEQMYFVYCIAHRAVAPLSAAGPRFRLIQGFPSHDAAQHHAMRVHKADNTTVLVGRLHDWQVVGATYEHLSDPDYQSNHIERLLRDKDEVDRENVKHGKNLRNQRECFTIDFADWCEAIGVSDPDVTDKISDWMAEHAYTIERVAIMSDDEASAVGVRDISGFRSSVTQWLRNALVAKGTSPEDADTMVSATMKRCIAPPTVQSSVTHQPVPEPEPEPEPESENPSLAAGESRKEPPMLPPNLLHKYQQHAVVIVVPDREGPDNEPLVKALCFTKSETEAEGYIRNTAGDQIKDHDMHVVAIGEWLDPSHAANPSKMVHRDKELQKIMDSFAAQTSRIASMKARTEDVEDGTPL